MHEDTITSDSDQQSSDTKSTVKGITSFSDIIDDSNILTSLSSNGYSTPSAAHGKALPIILEGTNIIGHITNKKERALLFAVPLLKDDSDSTTLVLTGSGGEVERITELLKELGIEATPIATDEAASGLKLTAGATIVSSPATLIPALLEGDLTIDITRIVLEGLDEAPTPLHSEASPAQLITSLLEKLGQKAPPQLIWLGKSEPLSFRVLMNNHFRSVDCSELNLESPSENNVSHVYFELENDLTAKPNALCDLIEGDGLPKTVIFCNSPSDADLVEVFLKKRGINSQKLIGHIPSHKVSSAVTDLQNGRCTALIVTDVSARGVNVEDLELVVNHSIHNDPEVYVHRMGNPGANSKLKKIVSLVGPTDLANFHYLKKLFEYKFEKGELPSAADLLQSKLDTLAVEPEDERFNAEKYSELAGQILEHDDSAKIVAHLLFNTLEIIPELRTKSSKGRRERNDRGRDRDRGDERGERSDRRDRRDSRNSRDNRKGDNRGDRNDRDRRDRREKREPSVPPKKDLRIYIGHGLQDGCTEERLAELVKQASSDESCNPERISIRDRYAFIDYPEKVGDSLLKKLEETEFSDGVPLIAYKATAITAPREEAPKDDAAKSDETSSEQTADSAEGKPEAAEAKQEGATEEETAAPAAEA